MSAPNSEPATEIEELPLQRNDTSNRNVQYNLEGLVVPDAVHERFREIYIFCDICKLKLVAQKDNIEEHFKSIHPSDDICLYCHGKVYNYYRMENDMKTEKVTYHKCKFQEIR